MTVERNRYVSSIPPLSLPTRWKQLTSTFSLSRSRTAPVSNNHLFEGDLQHRLFPPCNLWNPSRLSSRRWTSRLSRRTSANTVQLTRFVSVPWPSTSSLIASLSSSPMLWVSAFATLTRTKGRLGHVGPDGILEYDLLQTQSGGESSILGPAWRSNGPGETIPSSASYFQF